MARSMAVMRNSYREPLEEPLTSEFRMIGGEGRLLREHFRAGKSILGPLFSKIVYRSMAILEQNASMGLIVAAPTAGSSGVLPGALFSLQEESGLSDETVLQGLFCAGAIGQLMMRNGTVSGAEAGCQAEVGAASAMAAAATAEMYGGTPRACLDAASLALTNLLGLVCDPVAGARAVPLPDAKRPGRGKRRAVCGDDAFWHALVHPVRRDGQSALRRRPPPAEGLRETALGGCAATPTGLAWKEKIFGRD